jgi:integrase
MPYQYVREPLTAEKADRLANACETPTEQLIVWTLLGTGLRLGELCALTTKDILWQQRQLRVRGKGGPYRQMAHAAALLVLRSPGAGASKSARGSSEPVELPEPGDQRRDRLEYGLHGCGDRPTEV